MAILITITPAILYGTILITTVVIPTIIITNLIRRLLSDASIPSNLPWAGVPANGGALARARANLRSVFGMKALLNEGYTKVRRDFRRQGSHRVLWTPVVPPLSSSAVL